MRKRRSTPLMLAVAVLLVPFIYMRSCSPSHVRAPRSVESGEMEGVHAMSPANQPFTVSSPSFANGGEIPRRYSCDGDDASPALAWSAAPAGTQSLALIVLDPDAPAGTWSHWLLWNIPARATLLPEDTPKSELLDNGARQGFNDFRRIGYGGPCPPPGLPHRYFFNLYALDARLDLKPGSERADLEAAIKLHILGETQWVGIYKR